MPRATVASSIIAVMILLSFFVQFDRAFAVLYLRHGDGRTDITAVNIARGLHSIVISPQDPTIAYRAKKYFGDSLTFELDTHVVNGNWPSDLPEPVCRELDSANFVVQVKSFVPNPMFDRGLKDRAFCRCRLQRWPTRPTRFGASHGIDGLFERKLSQASGRLPFSGNRPTCPRVFRRKSKGLKTVDSLWDRRCDRTVAARGDRSHESGGGRLGIAKRSGAMDLNRVTNFSVAKLRNLIFATGDSMSPTTRFSYPMVRSVTAGIFSIFLGTKIRSRSAIRSIRFMSTPM